MSLRLRSTDWSASLFSNQTCVVSERSLYLYVRPYRLGSRYSVKSIIRPVNFPSGLRSHPVTLGMGFGEAWVDLDSGDDFDSNVMIVLRH